VQNSRSRDRLARFRQMLRANFDKSCGAGEADFSKHPGFKMLVKTLNHDPQPLSAGEELELAMKSLAAYRETFDAKEKRVVEERAAQNAISRRKSPFDALDLGSRSLTVLDLPKISRGRDPSRQNALHHFGRQDAGEAGV